MTKLSKGYKTLAEHHAELKEKGLYDDMIAGQEARRREIDKRLEEERVAHAPLVADLRAAGFDVDTVHNLHKVKGSRAKAVPILLAHFSRPYPSAIRASIGDELAIPEAKSQVWKEILRFYREESDHRVSEGLANAIIELANDDDIDDLLDLVRDPTVGETRSFFLRILNKSKDPRGKQTILELADEPDLREEIKVIRKKWERNAIKRAQKAAQKNPTRH